MGFKFNPTTGQLDIAGDVAADTHAATGKTTPADADEMPLVDSAASNVLKKLTWANLKATLKTYFDGLYPSGSGTSTGTNTGDVAFATNAVVLGTAAAAGAASTVMRSNDTIAAFDATAPSTQAFGDSAATGSAAVAARRDHKHAMPATPTSVSGNAGTATALQTGRTINGTSFDGTANITTPLGTMPRSPRSSNTILAAADRGTVICATAAYTQTFTAAATLGAGWWVIVKNDTQDGTTVLVLDPNASETIDSLTTVTMYSGETRLIECDGSNFTSQLIEGGYAKFTPTGGIFVVPAGITFCDVVCIGSGGQGGGGASSVSTASSGGSGGGGGAVTRQTLRPGDLGSAGASVTVTVAAGGSGSGGGGTAGAGASGSNGGNGGTTSFGTLAKAGGGGGGTGGSAAGTPSGGAGGSAVNNAATTLGGTPASSTALGSAAGNSGTASEWGGAGGGNGRTSPTSGVGGAGSIYGGPGGGAGGAVNASNAGGNAGAGGTNQTYSTGGGAGNAGSAGASPTGGSAANGTSFVGPFCGSGAGGGGAETHNSAGAGNGGAAGGIGGIGAGGGGGGASSSTTSSAVGGAGGNGGVGECRVWYS